MTAVLERPTETFDILHRLDCTNPACECWQQLEEATNELKSKATATQKRTIYTDEDRERNKFYEDVQ